MIKMNERAYVMIMSDNIEMVRLGIIVLLNTHKENEVRAIIPWSTMHHEYEEAQHTFTLHPNISVFQRGLDTIFIKGKNAVTINNGRLICRSVGLMSVHHQFDKVNKIYLDG